jgi:hypothetical protein
MSIAAEMPFRIRTTSCFLATGDGCGLCLFGVRSRSVVSMVLRGDCCATSTDTRLERRLRSKRLFFEPLADLVFYCDRQ